VDLRELNHEARVPLGDERLESRFCSKVRIGEKNGPSRGRAEAVRGRYHAVPIWAGTSTAPISRSFRLRSMAVTRN